MAAARKRPSIRARAVASARHANLASSDQPVSTVPSRTKKDKRIAKHDTLLRRIREGGVQKSKTRRPGRKLRAAEDVDDLRNALPDISADHEGADDDEWEGLSDMDDEGAAVQYAQNGSVTGRRKRGRATSSNDNARMVMTSLQHRPGAMKRKRKMEQSEMDRFSKNLAQLSGGDVISKEQAAPNGTVSAGDKWAALRRFIGGTMEKDKAFAAG